MQDNVRLQNAVDNLAELAPDVVMKPEISHTSWDGISTLVTSVLGFWKCGRQLPASSSSSSLGAELDMFACQHASTPYSVLIRSMLPLHVQLETLDVVAMLSESEASVAGCS